MNYKWYIIYIEINKMSQHRMSLKIFYKRCRTLSEESDKAKEEGDEERSKEKRAEYEMWFNMIIKTLGAAYLDEYKMKNR